jgi:hypothetical protein
MKNTLALSAAAITLLITSLGAPAEAAYVVDLTQVADPSQPLWFDVVATGSGTIDLTDLSVNAVDVFEGAFIEPNVPAILTGPLNTFDFLYNGTFSGPLDFGGGGRTDASSGSGDSTGIDMFSGLLFVPFEYVSGAALSGASTWDNATLASLGATPGTYKWTWGTGGWSDALLATFRNR